MAKPYALVGSNQKGGTGKSTIILNVGACLAKSGRKTLIVELDKQGSVSGWLVNPEGTERLSSVARRERRTVSPVLEDASLLRDYAMPTKVEGLDVLCADVNLGRASKEQIQGILDHAEGRWDYVLFDLRRDVEESIDDVVGLGLRAIVPVGQDGEQLTGVKKVMDDLGRNCEFRLVDNFAHKIAVRDRILRKIRHDNVPNVVTFRQNVRYSTKFGEATVMGEPMVVYDPRNSAAKDLAALTEEIIEWCEGGDVR